MLELRDLDLYSLRGCKLHYFGLGFIQIKLNDTERLHFYDPRLPGITGLEEVHDHRYGFISYILKGSLTNRLYGLNLSDTHVVSSVSCDPQVSAPLDSRRTGLVEYAVHTYTEGQSYVMTADMYHRVEAVSCISYLTRTHKTKEFARVIRPERAPVVCPFSKQVPEEELWEIVGEMLGEKVRPCPQCGHRILTQWSGVACANPRCTYTFCL